MHKLCSRVLLCTDWLGPFVLLGPLSDDGSLGSGAPRRTGTPLDEILATPLDAHTLQITKCINIETAAVHLLCNCKLQLFSSIWYLPIDWTLPFRISQMVTSHAILNIKQFSIFSFSRRLVDYSYLNSFLSIWRNKNWPQNAYCATQSNKTQFSFPLLIPTAWPWSDTCSFKTKSELTTYQARSIPFHVVLSFWSGCLTVAANFHHALA